MSFDENIRKGVDAKLLVYEENAKIMSDKKIVLNDIMKFNFFKNKTDDNSNCILINIEEDLQRYERSLQEFKKISLTNFFHLKATFWKKRNNFINDINDILSYLKKFNNKIGNFPIEINDFSELNDNNIFIQDGPLACYCSHVRALIYGYENFKDYTIIVEDDISITNTENIEKYLPLIPSDWDVICFNSAPKNHDYGTQPYYKFVDEFHSGQFYIVKNSCMEFLFKNLYPITDQVDVLISNLYKQINIYNIVDTVYQRNISTNTQNNLHVIFNSPHYHILRMHNEIVINVLKEFINNELPQNEINNERILYNLIFDVLYSFISKSNNFSDKNDFYKSKIQHDNNKEIESNSNLSKLLNSINIIIKCSKKGLHTNLVSLSLTNNIINTIRNFKKYHNFRDSKYDELMKAYNYGSTAHVYILEKNQVICKMYNEESRWNIKGHDEIENIFTNELKILKKYNNDYLLFNDSEKNIIYLPYLGNSLYNSFLLPSDWKTQIENIFSDLNEKQIYYPEFNIKNILNKNSKLHFIDFGLASMVSHTGHTHNINGKNCENFIKLLQKLQDRFTHSTTSYNQLLILYNTFINNIKIHNFVEYSNNIF